MTIQEAIKSGRPFRRTSAEHWLVNSDAIYTPFYNKDILADDWELKPEELKERRVFCLISDEYRTDHYSWALNYDNRNAPNGKEKIQVTELRPGDRVLSRDDIKEAMVEIGWSAWTTDILKALGFPDEGE